MRRKGNVGCAKGKGNCGSIYGRRGSWQEQVVETLEERGRRELDERSGGGEEEGDGG